MTLNLKPRLAAIASTALLTIAAQAQQPPSDPTRLNICIDRAAAYHQVSAVLLRAIAWHEGGFKTHWVSKNTNGSRDIGALQINSIHLKELAQYGVHEADLLDGCVSAYVGAWHLKRQIDKYGLTWQAVGAYHSATPEHNAKYANIIIGVLASWGAIDVRDPRWQATRSALAAQAQSVAPPQRRAQAAASRRGADTQASPVVFDRTVASTPTTEDANE